MSNLSPFEFKEAIRKLLDSPDTKSEKLSDEQLKIFSIEKAVSIFKTMYDGKDFFPPKPIDDILSLANEIEVYINGYHSLDKKVEL